jgi:hypothetical protein
MMANPINGSGVPKWVRALAEILLQKKRQFATAGMSLTSARAPGNRLPTNSAFYDVFALALAVAATVFRLRTFVAKP